MAFIKSNEFYDLKIIKKSVLTILAVFLAMRLTGGAGFVVVIPFMLMALLQNRNEPLLFWIVLTNLLAVTNDFFAPKGGIFSAGYRLLLLGVGIYGTLLFFSLRTSKFVLPLLGIFAYLIYMILPSLQGWAPMIATFKLIFFSMTYMALAYVSSKAQADGRLDMRRLRSIMLAFAIVYLGGSLLVYPFPGISQMNAEELARTGTMGVSLYKGMLNHSQPMGVIICCFMIFLLGDLFFNLQRKDKLYTVLVLCGLFLIGKTSSRTAMGSLLAAVMFLAYNMMQVKGVNSRWKSKVMSTLTTVTILCAAAVLLIPSVRNRVARTAMKWSREDSAEEFSMEQAVSSRMGLVDYSLYLWKLKPTIGWGFQVDPASGELEKKSGGFVFSAPIEKGVWVTAILEEGGTFGLIIYSLYAIFAFIALMMNRAYMGSTVFLSIHISNLGEFTMFSMSSVGCVWYVMLFASLVFDAKRGKTSGPGAFPAPSGRLPGLGPRLGYRPPPMGGFAPPMPGGYSPR